LSCAPSIRAQPNILLLAPFLGSYFFYKTSYKAWTVKLLLAMSFEFSRRHVGINVIIFITLALPWLNPFASGPSAAIVPLLFSLVCAAMLIAVSSYRSRWLLDPNAGSAAIWALVFAGALSSVMGIMQYFGVGDSLSPWMNHTALGEAFGNLRQRNQFASLTNIALVALIWGYADSQHKLAYFDRTLQLTSLGWLPVLTLIGAALLGAGNAVSSSRTGLAQLVLVALLAIWWGQFREAKLRQVLLMAMLTYVLAAFALPRLIGLDPSASGIVARLHDGGPACASRVTLWSNVLHLISIKPWTGWGWGELDYAHFITLYPGTRFCEILDNAHNLPLHLAVELGLPVATLICGVAGWLVIRAKPWRETDATRQMAWAVLALIMLHSMLEYPLWYGPFQMTFALCVWLLCRKPPFNRALARVVATGIASILIAGTAYAAWDYHRISQIYLAPEERTEAYRDNTLEKLKASWLFRDQVRFAELTTAELTQENAAQINTLAKEVMHFSPEARVVQKVIESAVVLGHSDEALFFMQRFKAAYPQDYEQWVAANTGAPGLKSP
jgi:Virulence factor membrane-bound polymerase, C-terminal/O-Antigen ligase/Protein glycosylation ligase